MQELISAYLMLVTFATPQISKLKPSHLQAIQQSPYMGCASPVIGAYDAGPVPALEELAAAAQLIGSQTTKHVWPWVFVNRMVGRAEDSRHHGGAPPSPYFTRINAMDLDDAAGARSDYLALWRLSLKLAKRLGSPGVVLDLEVYNDSRTYRVPFVSAARKESADRVIEQLRGIGASMADIAADEFPNVLIWSLFTDLPVTFKDEASGREFRRTVSYMMLGLLDRAAERDIPLTLISGGETGLGYYRASLRALRDRMRQRAQRFEPFLSRYGKRFALAGTIAPWLDSSEITSWLRDAAGDHPPYKTLSDFEPLIRALLDAYHRVWIYGASAANYQPYNPAIAAKWNPVLKGMLERSQGR